MACLLLGGCGLLFGDAAGELRDDGGTKMPDAQGERIPYKLSIEVDGERRATADEKRAVATDPDGESEGVPLGGSPEESEGAGPAAPQTDAPGHEGTGATSPAPRGNSGLSDKMRALSQLEQLRSDPPDSLLGLERRARGDVETAVKLMHSQGYYDGTATFRMDSTTTPVTVRLHLTPGPRYVLGRASVHYEPVPVVPAALKHGKRRAPYYVGGAAAENPPVLLRKERPCGSYQHHYGGLHLFRAELFPLYPGACRIHHLYGLDCRQPVLLRLAYGAGGSMGNAGGVWYCRFFRKGTGGIQSEVHGC